VRESSERLERDSVNKIVNVASHPDRTLDL
jgi:hypothetical protein